MREYMPIKVTTHWLTLINSSLIFMALYLVLTFFFVQETSYIRPKAFDNDIHEHLAGEADSTTSAAESVSEKNNIGIAATETGRSLAEEKKFTYLHSLKLYNGRYSHENYLQAVTAPFMNYLLPAVAWASYSYGCSVAFAAAFSVSLSQIFTKPPYSFKTGSIGLMVLSSFIGTILGNAIPGVVADWVVKFLSRRNNGVYEPEFRLLLAFPSLVFGLAGFWGFGLSIHAKNHWIVPVFFYGLATFAGSILSLVSNTYLLDCHRKYAQDSYAAVTFVKGIMSFSITFFMNPWITKSGVVQVFFIIGLIHGIGAIWGLFLYVFGKKVSHSQKY